MYEDERIEELKDQISRLEDLDLREASDEVLENHLQAILRDYLHRDVICGLTAIFRVRLNDGENLFTHVDELMAPKPEQVLHRGRFNEPGAPRFYCSSAPNTAMFEPKIKAGDMMTVLVLGSRTDESHITLAQIGLHLTKSGLPEDLQHYRVNEDFNASLKRRGISRQWLIQDEFLCRLATREFDSADAPYRYRLSSAVARGFESEPEVKGLMYPGVAAEHHGLNISAYPEAIVQNYFPTEAWQLRVAPESSQWQWLAGRKEYFFEFERVSKLIHSNGEIEWIELKESQPHISQLCRAQERVQYWRDTLGVNGPPEAPVC